jgi:pimeloyl-ACP methyl ester carboxylesterase
MAIVLVHGVPDTHRLWDELRSHLGGRDVLTPQLPGFDSPVPAGFTATKEAYVDWLVGELERVGEPVDLVGHDWGSSHATLAKLGWLSPTPARMPRSEAWSAP